MSLYKFRARVATHRLRNSFQEPLHAFQLRIPNPLQNGPRSEHNAQLRVVLVPLLHISKRLLPRLIAKAVPLPG